MAHQAPEGLFENFEFDDEQLEIGDDNVIQLIPAS